MSKGIFNFIKSFLLVAMTIGCICIATLIYNMGGDVTVDTYFFRTNRNYIDRPDVPVSASDLQAAGKLNRMLLDNYIANAFGATPYANNKIKEDIVSKMSADRVIEYLQKNVWPETRAMTDNNILRTATIESMTPEPNNSYYWHVRIKFTTWRTPNDFSQEPEVEITDWSIAFAGSDKLRTYVTKGVSVTEYLEHGINDISPNPAWVFSFLVGDIARK